LIKPPTYIPPLIPTPPVTTTVPTPVPVVAVPAVNDTCPLAASVVNAPVERVVEPIGVPSMLLAARAATLKLPATFKLPCTPRPPVINTAPVVGLLLAVVPVNVTTPLALRSVKLAAADALVPIGVPWMLCAVRLVIPVIVPPTFKLPVIPTPPCTVENCV